MLLKTSLILILVACYCSCDNICSYTSNNGIVYDLSPLQGTQLTMSDYHDKQSTYYSVSICDISSLCQDHSACALDTSLQFKTSLGDIDTMKWSEEYSEGISLIYQNRDDDYEPSNFVITFECNSYVEYEIIDFLASESLNRLLIQSKYACTNTFESSSSSSSSIESIPSSNISTIGLISSVVLLSACFVLTSYIILVLMFKTKGKMEKKNEVAIIPPPV